MILAPRCLRSVWKLPLIAGSGKGFGAPVPASSHSKTYSPELPTGPFRMASQHFCDRLPILAPLRAHFQFQKSVTTNPYLPDSGWDESK